MRIAVIFDVPDHWGDKSDSSGFSSEGFDGVMEVLAGTDIVAGPVVVRDNIGEQDMEDWK